MSFLDYALLIVLAAACIMWILEGLGAAAMSDRGAELKMMEEEIKCSDCGEPVVHRKTQCDDCLDTALRASERDQKAWELFKGFAWLPSGGVKNDGALTLLPRQCYELADLFLAYSGRDR